MTATHMRGLALPVACLLAGALLGYSIHCGGSAKVPESPGALGVQVMIPIAGGEPRGPECDPEPQTSGTALEGTTSGDLVGEVPSGNSSQPSTPESAATDLVGYEEDPEILSFVSAVRRRVPELSPAQAQSLAEDYVRSRERCGQLNELKRSWDYGARGISFDESPEYAELLELETLGKVLAIRRVLTPAQLDEFREARVRDREATSPPR